MQIQYVKSIWWKKVGELGKAEPQNWDCPRNVKLAEEWARDGNKFSYFNWDHELSLSKINNRTSKAKSLVWLRAGLTALQLVSAQSVFIL